MPPQLTDAASEAPPAELVPGEADRLMTATLREKHGPSPMAEYAKLLKLKTLDGNASSAQKRELRGLEAGFHMDRRHVTRDAVAKIAAKPTEDRSFQEACIWDAAIRKAGRVRRAQPDPPAWDDKLVVELIFKPRNSQPRQARRSSARSRKRRLGARARARAPGRKPRRRSSQDGDGPSDLRRAA